MRKWMSERLKRRKKSGDSTGKEAKPAPEPLQPRFYDNEPAALAPVQAEPVEVETHGTSPVEPDQGEPEAASPASPTSTATPRPRPQRRRRGRGGRSGARQRPAAPAVEAEPSAEEAPLAEPSTAVSAAGPEVASLPPAEAPVADAAPSQPAAVQTAPVPAHHAPARPSKGTVVLAIGLPGSGKSSWFKRHNIHPLSSDLLRELLFDDAQEQRFQDLVFSNLRSMLKARLIARRPMNYVDATNLTPHDRHSWIKLAKDYGYDVQGVFFDVPLEVCLERHQRRGRAIPEDIMRKMAGKLKPPTFEEGFSKITVVRVKQKEASAG